LFSDNGQGEKKNLCAHLEQVDLPFFQLLSVDSFQLIKREKRTERWLALLLLLRPPHNTTQVGSEEYLQETKEKLKIHNTTDERAAEKHGAVLSI
jgi:hypothetical protein